MPGPLTHHLIESTLNCLLFLARDDIEPWRSHLSLSWDPVPDREATSSTHKRAGRGSPPPHSPLSALATFQLAEMRAGWRGERAGVWGTAVTRCGGQLLGPSCWLSETLCRCSAPASGLSCRRSRSPRTGLSAHWKRYYLWQRSVAK